MTAAGLDERQRPACGHWEPMLGPCLCGDPANHEPGGQYHRGEGDDMAAETPTRTSSDTWPSVVIEHLASELGLEGTTGVPKAQRVRDRVHELVQELEGVEDRVARAVATAAHNARQFRFKVAAMLVGDDASTQIVDDPDTILRMLNEVLERGKLAEETLTNQIQGQQPRLIQHVDHAVSLPGRAALLAELLVETLPDVGMAISDDSPPEDVVRYTERVRMAGDLARRLLDEGRPKGAG